MDEGCIAVAEEADVLITGGESHFGVAGLQKLLERHAARDTISSEARYPLCRPLFCEQPEGRICYSNVADLLLVSNRLPGKSPASELTPSPKLDGWTAVGWSEGWNFRVRKAAGPKPPVLLDFFFGRTRYN